MCAYFLSFVDPEYSRTLHRAVVAQGEPEQVVAMGRVSHTAVALANFLENRRAGSAVHES
jgi:hypothetical protein